MQFSLFPRPLDWFSATFALGASRSQETLFTNINAERGIHEHIAEAISSCDQTDRPELYANIVIAGGSTCFDGFEKRLEAELRRYVQENVSSQAARQCHVVWKKNRKYSAWQGASQMSALAGSGREMT